MSPVRASVALSSAASIAERCRAGVGRLATLDLTSLPGIQDVRRLEFGIRTEADMALGRACGIAQSRGRGGQAGFVLLAK